MTADGVRPVATRVYPCGVFAELVRFDHLGPTETNGNGKHTRVGNFAPTVAVSSDKTFGLAPLTVTFTSDVEDPEGQRLRYERDFDADGRVDSRAADPTFTYTGNGVYHATLKVTDQGGRWSSDYVEIIVGNNPADGRPDRHAAAGGHGVQLR